MAKQTWTAKRDCERSFKIKVIEKKFADIPAGSKMLIATPKIIENYLRNIPKGTTREQSVIRQELAEKYNADKTCPVTTGIFIRIIAEASFEDYQSGKDIQSITPFWRVINPNSKLAQKLCCGIEFIIRQRKLEGIE